MKDFLKNNWLYFFLYLIILCWAGFYLLQLDKVSIHVKINDLVGNVFLDNFFKYFTNIGDGIFAILLGVIILCLNIRNGVYLLVTYIVSGTITSILKNYFYDVNRPHFVFGYFVHHIKLKLVEGVDMMGLNSFPSGHSTSAFAVFTCLALISTNRILKIVFLLTAICAAFSRTYLSQHWLVDITIGSLIGTITALVFYFIFIYNNKFQKLNKPLFNSKRS